MNNMAKSILSSFACAAASVMGTLAGFAAYGALANPDNRAKIKDRFIKIKDAIFDKEGR